MNYNKKYTPTKWKDGQEPAITADRLNNIEGGISQILGTVDEKGNVKTEGLLSQLKPENNGKLLALDDGGCISVTESTVDSFATAEQGQKADAALPANGWKTNDDRDGWRIQSDGNAARLSSSSIWFNDRYNEHTTAVTPGGISILDESDFANPKEVYFDSDSINVNNEQHIYYNNIAEKSMINSVATVSMEGDVPLSNLADVRPGVFVRQINLGDSWPDTWSEQRWPDTIYYQASIEIEFTDGSTLKQEWYEFWPALVYRRSTGEEIWGTQTAQVISVNSTVKSVSVDATDSVILSYRQNNQDVTITLFDIEVAGILSEKVIKLKGSKITDDFDNVMVTENVLSTVADEFQTKINSKLDANGWATNDGTLHKSDNYNKAVSIHPSGMSVTESAATLSYGSYGITGAVDNGSIDTFEVTYQHVQTKDKEFLYPQQSGTLLVQSSDGSFQTGDSVTAAVSNSTAFGVGTKTEVLAYPINNIDVDKKQITVTNLDNETLVTDGVAGGMYVFASIPYLGTVYKFRATILAVENNTLTLDVNVSNDAKDLLTALKLLDVTNYQIVIDGGKFGTEKYKDLSTLTAHAEGKNTVARIYGHSEGVLTEAKGYAGHAEGGYAIAKGEYSHAENYKTEAIGHASHAEGVRTKATGNNSHAEGSVTEAYGEDAHIEGYSGKTYQEIFATINNDLTKFNYEDDTIVQTFKDASTKFSLAKGDRSHVEGQRNVAIGLASHAEGLHNLVQGQAAHVEGYSNSAIAADSHAEGAWTITEGEHSHAEGCRTRTTETGGNAHAEGYSTIASGTAAHAEGGSTAAIGSSSHAEGSNTKAVGSKSHAEGGNTVAQGENSHAEGFLEPSYDTTKYGAHGSCSHSEGRNTFASGKNTHAEGFLTVASGEDAHAEGQKTTASGVRAHAEGYNTLASGGNAHTEGADTKALSDHTHAEGKETTAQSTRSHAEGYKTLASGHTAHVEGYQTIASGAVAHAEGYRSDVALERGAFGHYSHIEGQNTMTATGTYNSHAEGLDTVAAGNNQHVQGKYNVADSDKAHIVGGGTSDKDRKNIHTIDWDGNAEFAGTIKSSGSVVLTEADMSKIIDSVIKALPRAEGVIF